MDRIHHKWPSQSLTVLGDTTEIKFHPIVTFTHLAYLITTRRSNIPTHRWTSYLLNDTILCIICIITNVQFFGKIFFQKYFKYLCSFFNLPSNLPIVFFYSSLPPSLNSFLLISSSSLYTCFFDILLLLL